MNFRSLFRKLLLKKTELERIEEIHFELLEESNLDIYFLVLTLGACVIATFGLISNSAAVIIGAMIIAPLMLPIRGLAFGSLEGNRVLFRQSLTSIVAGSLVSIFCAGLIGFVVTVPKFGSEVLSRSQPTLIDLGIAIAAGAISGLAKVEPKIESSLAGTAISVALMPPLCVIGLGLSQADWRLSLGAILLYATNLLGITLSCMVTFLLTGCVSLDLDRGRRAFRRTIIFTSLLLFPLSASFIRLLRQAELEALVKQVLVNHTETFKRAELIGSDIDWLTEPPEVHLDVLIAGILTPKQVRLLEEFVAEQTGQRFTLIFNVGKIEEVRAKDNEQSPTTTE